MGRLIGPLSRCGRPSIALCGLKCSEDEDLVFARFNGAPLRPDWVVDRFHDLTAEASLAS